MITQPKLQQNWPLKKNRPCVFFFLSMPESPWSHHPIDFPKDFTQTSTLVSNRFMESFARGQLSCTVPSSMRVWVLRNLSKREQVRSNGISFEHNRMLVYDHCIGLDGSPGLGDVLISRLGWSSDPSISMSYKRGTSPASPKALGGRYVCWQRCIIMKLISKENRKNLTRNRSEALRV